MKDKAKQWLRDQGISGVVIKIFSDGFIYVANGIKHYTPWRIVERNDTDEN